MKMFSDYCRCNRSQLVLIALCCLFVSYPVIRLLLPAPLRLVDNYYLLRLAIDQQNFPVQTVAADRNQTKVTISVGVTNISSYLLRMDRIMNNTNYKDDSDLGYFKPLMTVKDKINLILTFEIFKRACEEENLTYFLWGGSLLGAYRHHGFIPWDDDFDLVMNASDWRKIKRVLSRVEGYGLYAPAEEQWKFFKNGLQPFPGKPFNWPFLDIFFFTYDSSHLWSLTKSLKYQLMNPISDIFPVQLRPFENIYAAVPCKMEEIVLRIYGIYYCSSVTCRHRDNVPVESLTVPCKRLYSVFPFVFRRKDENTGNVIETLKRGNRLLRNVTFPAQRCV